MSEDLLNTKYKDKLEPSYKVIPNLLYDGIWFLFVCLYVFLQQGTNASVLVCGYINLKIDWLASLYSYFCFCVLE